MFPAIRILLSIEKPSDAHWEDFFLTETPSPVLMVVGGWNDIINLTCDEPWFRKQVARLSDSVVATSSVLRWKALCRGLVTD